MPLGESPDPVRSTLIAILQQLNRAESVHEGSHREQALTLADLDRLLRKLPPIEDGEVKVALALGLLVRNGFVEAEATPGFTGKGRAPAPAHYRITAGGKQFLVDSQAKTERIR
jgi:hypothetical protein